MPSKTEAQMRFLPTREFYAKDLQSFTTMASLLCDYVHPGEHDYRGNLQLHELFYLFGGFDTKGTRFFVIAPFLELPYHSVNALKS